MTGELPRETQKLKEVQLLSEFAEKRIKDKEVLNHLLLEMTSKNTLLAWASFQFAKFALNAAG